MSALPAVRAATSTHSCRLLFSASAAGTRLERASAGAPWRVLRAPTADVCEATVLQTRGGLIDGDRWRFSAHAERGAHVRLRATGATIVYSGPCVLRTTLHASSGARLVQRSRGLILRPGAALRATTIVHADSGGGVVATEAVAVPDQTRGILRSVIVRDTEIVLDDRLRLDAELRRPWRLGAFTHVGTLIAVVPGRRVPFGTWARALPPSAGACIPRRGCLLVRVLAHSIDEIDVLFERLVAQVVL